MVEAQVLTMIAWVAVSVGYNAISEFVVYSCCNDHND